MVSRGVYESGLHEGCNQDDFEGALELYDELIGIGQ